MEAFQTFQLTYCLAGGVLIYALGAWLFSKPRSLLLGLPSLALMCFALGATSFAATWALAYISYQSPIEAVLVGNLPGARLSRGAFVAYGLWVAAFLFLVHGTAARISGGTSSDR